MRLKKQCTDSRQLDAELYDTLRAAIEHAQQANQGNDFLDDFHLLFGAIMTMREPLPIDALSLLLESYNLEETIRPVRCILSFTKNLATLAGEVISLEGRMHEAKFYRNSVHTWIRVRR
jgi:hypothetical protein